MAAILLVLFLVTFLFDTRMGIAFLVAAIVLLVRRAPARKRRLLAGDAPAAPAKSWKDPWQTTGLR